MCTQCVAFVNQYSGTLIQLIDDSINPEALCEVYTVYIYVHCIIEYHIAGNFACENFVCENFAN